MAENKSIKCTGCGAHVPDTDGPTHAYIGASPGCWAIYGEVLVKEFGEFCNPPVHRLTVDTYAVQHPGTPSRRSIQSVAVHLLNLYLVFERNFKYKMATAAMRKVLKHRDQFTWLDPPDSLGEVTVLDVRGAADLTEHHERAERWAKSVFAAWSPHHATLRQWAQLLGP
jgi:hypothetical protein